MGENISIAVENTLHCYIQNAQSICLLSHFLEHAISKLVLLLHTDLFQSKPVLSAGQKQKAMSFILIQPYSMSFKQPYSIFSYSCWTETERGDIFHLPAHLFLFALSQSDSSSSCLWLYNITWCEPVGPLSSHCFKKQLPLDFAEFPSTRTFFARWHSSFFGGSCSCKGIWCTNYPKASVGAVVGGSRDWNMHAWRFEDIPAAFIPDQRTSAAELTARCNVIIGDDGRRRWFGRCFPWRREQRIDRHDSRQCVFLVEQNGCDYLLFGAANGAVGC